MPETLVILEKSVSYRLLDSVVVGLMSTVLGVLAVRSLWWWHRRFLGGLLSVVVVLFAWGTIETARNLYRDTHPARSIFTLADGQVTIQRSQDQTPGSFRPGEVEQMSLAPLSARTDQLLLFSRGRIYVVDVSAAQSHTLAVALARTLHLTPTAHTMDTWLPASKAE